MVSVLTYTRAVYGSMLAIAPGQLTRRLGGRPVPNWVARVLGVRMAAESIAVAARSDDETVLVTSAAVDALHAASMFGLAAVQPQHRRLALISALEATASAIVLLVHRGRLRTAGGPGHASRSADGGAYTKWAPRG
jgi:hypothetical protein